MKLRLINSTVKYKYLTVEDEEIGYFVIKIKESDQSKYIRHNEFTKEFKDKYFKLVGRSAPKLMEIQGEDEIDII